MGKSSGKVTIKKYANRRLYDTESSSYITLDRLGAMIREGRDFEVIDAKSGDDITHQVLTQIIVEEESRGEGATMLPVNFLRQLIGLYGGQMQGAVPQYLEAAMDMFSKNQAAMRDAVGGAPFGGATMFADLAKRNMAMLEEAGRAFVPGAAKKETAGEPQSEVDKLRAELAALQAKVDRLGK
jgi:polyhydroxyalkanoate synthesis repressor PhaR